MATYFYNEIPLPEIPQEAYSYSYIEEQVGSTETFYIATFLTKPLYVSEGSSYFSEKSTGRAYKLNGEVWELYVDFSDESSAMEANSYWGVAPFWSNQDANNTRIQAYVSEGELEFPCRALNANYQKIGHIKLQYKDLYNPKEKYTIFVVKSLQAYCTDKNFTTEFYTNGFLRFYLQIENPLIKIEFENETIKIPSIKTYYSWKNVNIPNIKIEDRKLDDKLYIDFTSRTNEDDSKSWFIFAAKGSGQVYLKNWYLRKSGEYPDNIQ